jgi:hypothetical protein
MGTVTHVNFRKFDSEQPSELTSEIKEQLREIYSEAARELNQLTDIIYANNPNEEMHLPIPPGLDYSGDRGYHPDYSFQELWQLTAGFQDPDPPSMHDRQLFEEGKIEL